VKLHEPQGEVSYLDFIPNAQYKTVKLHEPQGEVSYLDFKIVQGMKFNVRVTLNIGECNRVQNLWQTVTYKGEFF
jgi:hypothetical protein